jgi:hypothetical protein
MPQSSNAHNELKLDALFGQRFYQFDHELPDPKVSFPLPSSAETLHAFFASDEGEQFRVGVNELLDKLEKWGTENDLDGIDACAHFKQNFMLYSGSNAEVNESQLPLYKQGIPYLADIIRLLSNQEISIDYRKNVIKNLFQGMVVCAPGTYTNIIDAYWELVARLSTHLEWMVARRSIAEQTALEVLQAAKKALHMPDNNGMEIHYVNALLNQYSDNLAIKNIEDSFAAFCDGNLIVKMSELFYSAISKRITAEKIVSHIISELSLETLAQQTLEILQEYELRFNRYGPDALFCINDLFDLSEIPPVLRWDHEYLLFLTLMRRLTASGYFDLSQIERRLLLSDDITIHFLTEHSLKFASIIIDKQSLPLVPYCVEQFARNHKFSEPLENFIRDQLSNEERFELVMGALSYIKSKQGILCDEEVASPSFLQCNEKILLKWLDLLSALHRSQEHFDLILQALPETARAVYLRQIGFDNLKHLIKSTEQLCTVLDSLSKDQSIKLLKELDRHKLRDLLDSGTMLAKILSHLPEEEWDIVFRALQSKITKGVYFSIVDEDIVPLLQIIFTRLPTQQWDSCCKKLGFSDWLHAISKLSHVCELFKALPEDKALLMLRSMAPDKMHDISVHRVFLRKRYDTDAVVNLLNTATKEKIALFLKFFDLNVLKKMFSSTVILLRLSMLPSAKTTLLLETLGREHMQTVKGEHLCFLLKYISIDFLTLLFSYFNADELASKFTFNTLTLFLRQADLKKTAFLLQRLDQEGLKKLVPNEKLPKFIETCLLFAPNDVITLVLRAFGQEYLSKNLKPLRLYIINLSRIQTAKDPSDYELGEAATNLLTTIFDTVGPEQSHLWRYQIICDIVIQILNDNPSNPNQSDETFILEGLKKQGGEDSEALLKSTFDFLGGQEQFLRLAVQWMRLLKISKDGSVAEFALFIQSLAPNELWTMIYCDSVYFLNEFPKKKSLFIFNVLDENQVRILLDSLNTRIEEIPLSTGLNKLPKKLREPFLMRFSVEQLSALIADRETLFLTLNSIHADKQIELISKIGQEQLHALLLTEHTLDDTLQLIQSARDRQTFNACLLATVMAQHEEQRQSLLTRLVSIFTNTPYVADEAFNLLESAIKEGHGSANKPKAEYQGLRFFDDVSVPNKVEVMQFCHKGDLGKLTQVFKNY